MVSINPKITPKVSLKLPNSGNGNEGNTQETGKNTDENAKAVYVPGKSIGDIKPDVLLAYNGVTIGRPGQVVEPPKAKPQSVVHWDSQEDFERTVHKGIYKVGDTISFMKDGILYKGVVEEDSGHLFIDFTAVGGPIYGYELT